MENDFNAYLKIDIFNYIQENGLFKLLLGFNNEIIFLLLLVTHGVLPKWYNR